MLPPPLPRSELPRAEPARGSALQKHYGRLAARRRTGRRSRLAWPDTDDSPVTLPAATGPLLAPDRLSVWPVEGERYGLDATYHGATGFERAEAQLRRLQAANLRASLRQELGDCWTLRLGPLAHGGVDRHRSLHWTTGLTHGSRRVGRLFGDDGCRGRAAAAGRHRQHPEREE